MRSLKLHTSICLYLVGHHLVQWLYLPSRELAKYSLYRKTVYHAKSGGPLKGKGQILGKSQLCAPGGLVPASSSQIITIKFHVNKVFYCGPSENHWHEAIFLAYQISALWLPVPLEITSPDELLRNLAPKSCIAQCGWVSASMWGERTVLSLCKLIFLGWSDGRRSLFLMLEASQIIFIGS